MLLSVFMIMCIVGIANTNNPFCDISSTHLLCTQEIGDNCNKYEKNSATTKIIDKILELHNSARQNVANGNVEAKGRNKLPQASNMLEMRWSNSLAITAQSMANRCKFDHSSPKDRKLNEFSLGENLAMLWGSSPSNVDEAIWEKNYFKNMFDEKNNYDANQVGKFDGLNKQEGQIGHFTQMIWAESYLIGCAGSSWYDDVTHKGMPYTTLLVCHYGPVGNVLTMPLYKQGKPASKCPDKTSVKYNGLCNSDKLVNPEYSPPDYTDRSEATKETPSLKIFCIIATAIFLSN